jgi:radical SAM superfamily enzyme YgiQ (UPF0313 family)
VSTLVVGLGPWLDRDVFLHGDAWTFRDVRAFFREGVMRSFTPNLSCIAVATCLRDLGEDVEYLDLPLELGVPFTAARRAEWRERLRRFLARRRFENAFFSCVSSAEHGTLAEAAALVREAWPGAVLGVGSYHANTLREELLADVPALDFVFLGDLEPVARELMARLATRQRAALAGLEPVLLRGTPVAGRRPATLPRTRAESRFDYRVCARYLPSYDMLAALGSKGCPFSCAFCQEKVVRRLYDVRGPDAVLEETEASYAIFEDRCGHRDVAYGYMDPMFGLDPRWTEGFCGALERAPGRFPWAFQTRVGSFSAGTVARFARLGCRLVYYGLESFSPQMLLRMSKTRQPKRYLERFRADLEACEREGIAVEANVLFGHPGETQATLAETRAGLRWLARRHPRTSLNLNLFRPLPDTESSVASPEEGCELLLEGWWKRGVVAGATVLVRPSAELEPAELLRFYGELYVDGRCYERRGVSAELTRWFEEGGIPPEAMPALGTRVRERVMAAMRERPARALALAGGGA